MAINASFFAKIIRTYLLTSYLNFPSFGRPNKMTATLALELAANEGFAANAKRGTGHVFDQTALDRFLLANQLSHVVRAHEVYQSGFMVRPLPFSLVCHAWFSRASLLIGVSNRFTASEVVTTTIIVYNPSNELLVFSYEPSSFVTSKSIFFQCQLKGKLISVFSSARYCGGSNESGVVLLEGGKLRLIRVE